MTIGDYDDAALVAEAVAMAERQAAGVSPSLSEVSLLRAIASTRDEARRHELARRAESITKGLTELGVHLIRFAIFGLPT